MKLSQFGYDPSGLIEVMEHSKQMHAQYHENEFLCFNSFVGFIWKWNSFANIFQTDSSFDVRPLAERLGYTFGKMISGER